MSTLLCLNSVGHAIVTKAYPRFLPPDLGIVQCTIIHNVMREVPDGLHNILLRRIECNVSDVDLVLWRRYELLAHCLDSGLAGDVILDH